MISSRCTESAATQRTTAVSANNPKTARTTVGGAAGAMNRRDRPSGSAIPDAEMRPNPKVDLENESSRDACRTLDLAAERR